MYCPDCGHSNNESNTFCMKCGKNLKEASENNYNETMSENEYNLVYDSDKKNYIFSFVSSIAGVLLCVLGCFLPFVSMNLGFVNNSMKYIDGDGKIVCGIMGLAILLSILKYQKLNIVTSASVLIMLGIELYPLFYSESGEYIGGLIDFEVGFYFVIIGAVTLLVGAIVAFQGKWDKTNKSVFIAFSVISIILIAGFFTISNESDNKNDENNEIAVDYTTPMQTEAANTITTSTTTNKATTTTATKATTLPAIEKVTEAICGASDILGYWAQDNPLGRNDIYWMEITDMPDGTCNVIIDISGGASLTHIYSFNGYMDSSGVLYYENGMYGVLSYSDSGEKHESYKDSISGTLSYINGNLYWNCYFDSGYYENIYDVHFMRN